MRKRKRVTPERADGKVLIFRMSRRDPKTGKTYRSPRPIPMWVKPDKAA